jgi:type VI secretion system protein ImpG
MNQEFLELYNRELRILKEHAKEFAEEFPGVAERLGGLLENNMDPMIGGLLEGTAYLASRVQLKLKHEYSQFTNNLLDQLVPDYLAPVPSMALLRVDPPFAEPSLKDGIKISGGTYADARFVERERRIACRYRLSSNIHLWPFEIASAEFLPSPASLQGLGVDVVSPIQSGLKLSLLRRTTARREDEPTAKQSAKKADGWISKCRTSDLTFYIVCQEADAVRIYEKIFANTKGIYIRHLNAFGDPVISPLPRECLQQIGFGEDEALFPTEKRVFSGFDLLREFFVFPAKFLGFKLVNLDKVLPHIDTNRLDVILAFDLGDNKLNAVVKAESFAMYAVPAVNLFEMTTARVPIKQNEYEYHVVTDRSRHLDFEVHRILKIQAHFSGGGAKTEVFPLYAAPPLEVLDSETIYYTIRRLPRRRSEDERRFGQSSRYVGTDVFVTLSNHLNADDELRVTELTVRALCSNRHLTEFLPVGQGGADFILEEKTALKVSCISGPTLPRDSTIAYTATGASASLESTSAWRLISMLSLNHLGLTGRGTDDSAAALRELLSLFANRSDAATERRIRGIIAIENSAINRRVRQKNGAGVVRGLEIRVTMDEKAFEGSGIFLMGAILDRFFAEYVGINNAVQTVIISSERGVIMRWPVRMGRQIEL